MTVGKLIDKSLRVVGIDPTSADAWQIDAALDHLNFIVSNFAYWTSDDVVIPAFTSTDDEFTLPDYYLEVFELLLAAREGVTYHLPPQEIVMLEQKAKQLTDRLVYRRQVLPNPTATTIVI